MLGIVQVNRLHLLELHLGVRRTIAAVVVHVRSSSIIRVVDDNEGNSLSPRVVGASIFINTIILLIQF